MSDDMETALRCVGCGCRFRPGETCDCGRLMEDAGDGCFEVIRDDDAAYLEEAAALSRRDGRRYAMDGRVSFFPAAWFPYEGFGLVCEACGVPLLAVGDPGQCSCGEFAEGDNWAKMDSFAAWEIFFDDLSRASIATAAFNRLPPDEGGDPEGQRPCWRWLEPAADGVRRAVLAQLDLAPEVRAGLPHVWRGGRGAKRWVLYPDLTEPVARLEGIVAGSMSARAYMAEPRYAPESEAARVRHWEDKRLHPDRFGEPGSKGPKGPKGPEGKPFGAWLRKGKARSK